MAGPMSAAAHPAPLRLPSQPVGTSITGYYNNNHAARRRKIGGLILTLHSTARERTPEFRARPKSPFHCRRRGNESLFFWGFEADQRLVSSSPTPLGQALFSLQISTTGNTL